MKSLVCGREMETYIAGLIGRADYLEGLVGKGPYQIKDPQAEMKLMAATNLCGANKVVLVKWRGKLILFIGEYHTNEQPCLMQKASNFFQSLMHLITESPTVELIYEGHRFMVTEDAEIVEKMASKPEKYPFHLLRDCLSIKKTAHYLDILRCIHSVLIHSKKTPRVKSLLKRITAFDCREPIMSDPNKRPSAQQRRKSLQAAIDTGIADASFVNRATRATTMHEYVNLFIEFPDHLAYRLLRDSQSESIAVYSGSDHIKGILRLMSDYEILSVSASDGRLSCAIPQRT